MTADAADQPPPRRRMALRAQLDAANPMQPAELRFRAAADAPGTDLDVLMGYQIFLGRDPENSFVISDAKASAVRGFIRGLLGSGEFQAAVATPLMRGQNLPHERVGAAPLPQHAEWLTAMLFLDATTERAIASATDWNGFWRALAALPGMPLTPQAAESLPAGNIAAAPADEGFVLITLDQPKPGEKLHPGALLSGVGWAIAPADITEVDIYLDETRLGQARYGLPRPDVARNFPHYRHVDHCGFAFTTQIPGDATITAASQLCVIVRTAQGHTGRRAVRIGAPAAAPTAAAAAPWPVRLFVEDVRVDAASADLTVRGWAIARDGIARVTVGLGDTVLGDADLGMARPDLAATYADYPRAAFGGFLFTTSLRGQAVGNATLRVQAFATDGVQRQALVPLAIPPSAAEAAPRLIKPKAKVAAGGAPVKPQAGHGMRLEIDRPALAQGRAITPLRGAVSIVGWTVAPEGIRSVRVLRDGEPLGDAYVGMRREDIARAFPDCQDSLRAGFALVLPPGALPEGASEVTVVATSHAGATTERTFAVLLEPSDSVLLGSTPRPSMPRAEQRFADAVLSGRDCRPHFTIAIQPAPHDQDGAALATTLRSLARQAYPAFTARIVAPDKAAQERAVQAIGQVAAHAGGADGRFTLAASAPKAGAPAKPALFTTLVAGDDLGADALLELAVAYATDRASGFIYADDNRVEPGTDRPAPFYKPDFSPELLLAMDYVGRPWCADAATLAVAKLDATALATLAPYDLALRLTEAAPKVRHINKVLAALGSATEAPVALAAVRAAAKRRGLKATAQPGTSPGTWRLQRNVPPQARVSVIIPTAGRGQLIRRCITSLRATTKPDALEIIVLDNMPPGDKRLKSWLLREADDLIDMPGAFNWSRFNNIGAAEATSPYLLFLNDDIEALAPGWLESMLEHAQSPDVAVVGARLLYPDGKVQHGGQYLTETHARHAFRFANRDEPGPFGIATVAREMSSVTGACQMIRAALFKKLGRFDEFHDIINNDLDFCLRAQRAGYKVVYTPHATLQHHELATRAAIEDNYDMVRFAGDWRLTLLAGDPYHSRRLLPESDMCVPDPEPIRQVHAGPAGPPLDEVRRILAVKLDHIGDFLTIVPALRDLKRRFPAARLSLLCAPATAVLAKSESSVDEIIEFTFFHPRSAEGQRGVTKEEFAALQARLSAAAFDIAIDLRMQPETREVLRHTGARLLVGYDHNHTFPWLDVVLEWEGDRPLAAKRGHISERLVTLTEAAAAACRPLPPVVVTAAEDPARVPVLARLGADFLSRPLVCVHPGVGNPVRQWPAESYAALIDLLVAEDGMNVVLVGGGDEQEVARNVLSLVSAKASVVSLAGSVSLGELSGVIRACALFVGNNSGPKHIAAAAGVPTVGIHSAVVDAAEWAPLGGGAMALQRSMVCGPCYLEFATDCPRSLACLTGLRPRDALAACRRALALRPPAKTRRRPKVQAK